ncbi:hypothetical protein PoB_001875600 [Plakobranchus ocellatus]|uniref:RNase H type-1 domain-containing protein n=1 Tax=Plakobranchus ocellatus TaxID=259542 RepID=A0AAV3Z8L5_9GAST|nr:hypothetical protein PoB_001875600 [Plakobranchus ocellatus]
MSSALHLRRSTRFTRQNKEDSSEVAYQKVFFRIEEFSNHYAVYTDGSKLKEKIAAAVYFPECPDCSKATRQKDGIRRNENLDKLAMAALNRASYSRKLICWWDLKPKVNAYIQTVWQENWNVKGQTSSTKYSQTWEKTSAKEVKKHVENGRR